MSKRFNGGGVIHERMVVTMSVSLWCPLTVRKECAVKFVLNWTFAIKLPLGRFDNWSYSGLNFNSYSFQLFTPCRCSVH